jgi:hypothetical protein
VLLLLLLLLLLMVVLEHQRGQRGRLQQGLTAGPVLLLLLVPLQCKA